MGVQSLLVEKLCSDPQETSPPFSLRDCPENGGTVLLRGAPSTSLHCSETNLSPALSVHFFDPPHPGPLPSGRGNWQSTDGRENSRRFCLNAERPALWASRKVDALAFGTASQSRNGLLPLVYLPGHRPRGQVTIKLDGGDAAIGTLTSPTVSPLVGSALFPRPVTCDSGAAAIVEER